MCCSKFLRITVSVIGISLFLSSMLIAAVPGLISYQGRLTDPAGDPVVDGPYLVKFIIYDDPVAGSELWNSTFQTVNTVEGLFSIALGSSPMPPLPDRLFADPSSYLGITVGTDSEISPRAQLVSTPYSHHALFADSSGKANMVGSLHSTDIALSSHNHGGTYAEIPHFHSATDITSGTLSASHYSAYADLSAEGFLDNNASTDLLTRLQSDSRFALLSHSHSGYMDLASMQTVTGSKTFNGSTTYFGDSTMAINSNGISIGSGNPVINNIVRTKRQFNTTISRIGHYIDLSNQTTGALYGLQCALGSTSDAGGIRYGISTYVDNNLTSTSPQFGLLSSVGDANKTAGASYSVYAQAEAGSGSNAYAIFAIASGSGNTYAGYFQGNVQVNGTLSKSAGSFKIDHPLDPENKYLQHSFVESPDMMNIYNGNVVLDQKGTVTVTMPEWFEPLNRDFRYQLTAIGGPGPNLYIAEKMAGSQFTIAGGKPGMEVSWLVTGIRKDVYADANRIKVELDKPEALRGKYLHPEEHGMPKEMGMSEVHRIQSEQNSNDN